MQGFSCKIFRSLYLLDLRDFSLKNAQNSLKMKSCLSAASLILFRILSVFQALKNPYSLDFLFLFDQAKRKSIDNQLLIAKKRVLFFYRKTLSLSLAPTDKQTKVSYLCLFTSSNHSSPNSSTDSTVFILGVLGK